LSEILGFNNTKKSIEAEVTILQSKFHKIDSCVLMPRQPAKDYLANKLPLEAG
jgi:hypothetical protein